MSLLTVPLPHELSEKVETAVRQGHAATKADLARKALEHYLEDLAVLEVLRSEQEVKEEKLLSGDIRKLMKKI